jgi:hypothetical protein
MQFYILDADQGGSFTTPQGTVVHVPSSAFVNAFNQSPSGQVLIMFKDLYKKSDMLLADMTPMYSNGWPLKSGGEFFIKATQFGQPLQLAPGKKIVVEQPVAATGGVVDTAMAPLVFQQDTFNLSGWGWSATDSIAYTTSNYIFSLYQFNSPCDSGSWCNSDNPAYFSSYNQVSINLHCTQPYSDYHTDVFLLFHDVNGMVHVYSGSQSATGTDYTYIYAPLGLQATVVAIGVKDEKFCCSFTPITISSGMNVDFSVTESSFEDFKTQLEALN